MKYEELVAELRAYREFSEGSTGADLAEVDVCMLAADAIEALAAENARLAASKPTCAVVKPLVWTVRHGQYEHRQAEGPFPNRSPFPDYIIGSNDAKTEWYWCNFGEWDNSLLPSEDAAKAAAQADYEARVMSAITLRPEAEVRAEAWGAAIEAALDAADKYMRDQYGIGALSHPIDRGRILDNLYPPSDAQAMLDRIKAEVRTGVMQQISDVRTWFHYPIVMPIKDGRGPVSDAECDTITWEVWDQLLNTHASFDNLPDAINEAMRLNNAMQDDAQ